MKNGFQDKNIYLPFHWSPCDLQLASRQLHEKLQCLFENLMPNNFLKTAVLIKKYEL